MRFTGLFLFALLFLLPPTLPASAQNSIKTGDCWKKENIDKPACIKWGSSGPGSGNGGAQAAELPTKNYDKPMLTGAMLKSDPDAGMTPDKKAKDGNHQKTYAVQPKRE